MARGGGGGGVVLAQLVVLVVLLVNLVIGGSPRAVRLAVQAEGGDDHACLGLHWRGGGGGG